MPNAVEQEHSETTEKPRPESSLLYGDDLPLDRWLITCKLMQKEGGPVAGIEAVTRADLNEVLAELHFHGYARRGYPAVPGFGMNEMKPRLQPIYDREGGKTGAKAIVSYIMSVDLPDGFTYRRQFTALSVPYAAERAALPLIADGRLQQGDAYFYEIEMLPAPSGRRLAEAPPSKLGAAGMAIQTRAKSLPLSWLRVPLNELLTRATPVGDHDNRWSHVFYTHDAKQKAERLSRQGMLRTPTIETGAALVGTLCRCPDTADMFVVIADVLPVTDAQATQFSLEFTSQSWERITTLIAAKQARPATKTWRLLGQAHGHNFYPQNGALPCDKCLLQKSCPRSSVYISTDDLAWTRCVFFLQPFAISHIFGITARHLRPNQDEVEGLYGACDGRLLERGYHVIEAFDPAKYEAESA